MVAFCPLYAKYNGEIVRIHLAALLFFFSKHPQILVYKRKARTSSKFGNIPGSIEVVAITIFDKLRHVEEVLSGNSEVLYSQNQQCLKAVTIKNSTYLIN